MGAPLKLLAHFTQHNALHQWPRARIERAKSSLLMFAKSVGNVGIAAHSRAGDSGATEGLGP